MMMLKAHLKTVRSAGGLLIVLEMWQMLEKRAWEAQNEFKEGVQQDTG